jgi:hypothetical protein
MLPGCFCCEDFQRRSRARAGARDRDDAGDLTAGHAIEPPSHTDKRLRLYIPNRWLFPHFSGLLVAGCGYQSVCLARRILSLDRFLSYSIDRGFARPLMVYPNFVRRRQEKGIKLKINESYKVGYIFQKTAQQPDQLVVLVGIHPLIKISHPSALRRLRQSGTH